MDRALLDVDAVPLVGFGLEDAYGPVVSAWHAHEKHQLLYAAEGTLRLEVDANQWLLPPQRAAWIGAGVRHRVRAVGRVAALRTVYLAPPIASAPSEACVVFAAEPICREMMLYAMRWGPNRADDERARTFFAALAALAGLWAEAALPFRLPTAQTPELERAMAYAIEEMGGAPTLQSAARRAGLSERTLTRRFADEAQTTWRDFLHHARMMRAMELLGAPGARVTDTAFAVGFQSLAAFTRAFEEFAGARPKDFRDAAGGRRHRGQEHV